MPLGIRHPCMIYVTGDMHGSIARFEDRAISRLRREDYLIVCGDFGFIWDGNRREEKALSFLSRQRFTILFVDGCHENFDRLYKYPVTQWNGGKVRMIRPNVIHLCRGQVYELEGNKIFAMGGGYSADIELRQQRGTKWWPEETPTTEEMAEAVDNLFRYDLNVDYIVTHECPTKVKDLLVDSPDNFNAMTAFFDEMSRQVTYKHWFFGAMHQDKHLSSAHTALFEHVLPLEVPHTVFEAKKKPRL
ncbi:MAG: metallophosphoesterase [Clostridia bacterium]|nr:metallophosphoesterase [Clostridia bacterium]